MQIPAFHPKINDVQLPLERLANNSHLSPSQKLTEVSRQFEAVLLRQILSEAQKPVFQSKTAGPSVGGDVYRDLITNEMADQISRSGTFGLGRTLESQLHRELKPDDPAAPAPASSVSRPKGKSA